MTNSQEKPTAHSLTVEHAAYAAIGLLAAVLRFYQLGLRPLFAGEAEQALAAYQFARGAAAAAPSSIAPTSPGISPALFTGNLVGFSLLGAGDVTARLLPALAGTVLILLPLGLRHRLGRGGALAASLLLALSPAGLYFSRTLDGSVVAAACGLALIVSLVRYADTRHPGSLYLAAGALGLGLCAGPTIYTLLLILAIFFVLLYLGNRFLGWKGGWSAVLVASWALRDEKGLASRAGAVLAAVFGLAATALVLRPAGLGDAADLLGAWARGFLPEPGGQPALYPILLLLRYESLILLFGLGAGGWFLLGRGGASRIPDDSRPSETRPYGSPFPFNAFLAFWALVALAIVLLSGHRPASSILLVVLPLALLAGQGIDRALRMVSRRGLWPPAGLGAGLALGVGVFVYLQVAAYSRATPGATLTTAGITFYTTTAFLLLALVGLLLLAGLLLAAWFWRGPGPALAATGLALLVGLGLFGLKAAWSLSFSHASDARELMIGNATVPDVRVMTRHLEQLSVDEAGDAHTLPVTVDAATGPVVAWYLRDFRRLTVVEGLTEPPDTLAAVTLAAQDLPIGEVYRGQGYPVRTHWAPWGLGPQKLVHWLLFAEATLPIVDQEVVLWVASPSGPEP